MNANAEARIGETPTEPSAVLEIDGARAAVWWDNVAPLGSLKTGAIGRFNAASAQAAREVIDTACALLKRNGCAVAVGPMDGSVWGDYRWVTWSHDQMPLIPLEPRNPPEFPVWWTSSGFSVHLTYTSTFGPVASAHHPSAPQRWRTLAATGVNIREFRFDDFENELRIVYDVTSRAFTKNWMFSPLSWTRFAEKYKPFRSLIGKKYAAIAEHQGDPIGFVFGFDPSVSDPSNPAHKFFVAKTMGVVGEFAGTGLGTVLMDRLETHARNSGYSHTIHALMQTGNISSRLSGSSHSLLRNYALYAREL